MLDDPTKRAYKHRPNISAAAKALDVSYGHLRRVVCTRERTSPKLLSRFLEWKRTQLDATPTTTNQNPHQPKLNT
jgi:molybdenum-dependent DNA-binding transcriptional regulator ModE